MNDTPAPKIGGVSQRENARIRVVRTVSILALLSIIVSGILVMGFSGLVIASEHDLEASCTVSTTSVAVGEAVEIDASATKGASWIEFDTDGDGKYDTSREAEFAVKRSYDEPGEYTPIIRAHSEESSDAAKCGTITVTDSDDRSEPKASFTYSPAEPTVGEKVTFDARDSVAPDGKIVEYRWDFTDDGKIDRTTTDPVTTTSYETAGSRTVELTVVNDAKATGSSTRSVTVFQPEPIARCAVSPQSATVGEEVTIDASRSEHADLIAFDTDGDGEYDVFREADFVVTVSYDEPGEYASVVRVQSGDHTDVAQCPTITVTEPAEPSDPTASFTRSPAESEVGTEVSFDASASDAPDGELVEYRWDFDGDGAIDETNAGLTTTYTYTAVGTWTVTLTVVDDGGRTGSDERTVWIAAPPPVAACSLSSTSVRVGEDVSIDASGSENADWTAIDTDGDGEYDEFREADFVVTRSYDEPGRYTPTVRVHSGENTDVAECPTVTVSEPGDPIASFSASSANPEPGAAITFDASASSAPDGELVEYRWDFDGDGAVDETTASPTTTHTYASAGSRTAVLTVVDDGGRTSSTERSITVAHSYSEPIARCTVSPTSVLVGEEVTIDASASENVGLLAVDTDGDGEYDEFREADFVVTVSYDEPGRYTPVVRVQNGDHTDVAECSTISVREPGDPIASFTVDPTDPEPGQDVTFDATASEAPDGELVEYRWDFTGDGVIDETTSDPTTTYAYAVAGTRTITLTVVDDGGGTEADERTISVGAPPPIAACTVSSTTALVGETVTIDASASENAGWLTFDTDGDGEIDEGREVDFVVSVSYDAPGEYVPVVLAHAGENADVAECPTVTVGEPDAGDDPIASFTVDPADPEPGQDVTFDASASVAPDGAIVEYRWDFDDDGTIDETTTDPITTHTFRGAGPKSTALTVVTGDDRTADATRRLDVAPPPPIAIAKCSLSATSVDVGDAVTIDASASEFAYAVAFDTDGDGEYDEERRDAYVLTTSYDEPGEYDPNVLSRSELGADETACGTVTVADEPVPPDVESERERVPGTDVAIDDLPLEEVGIVALALAAGGLVWYFRPGTPSPPGDDGPRAPVKPPKAKSPSKSTPARYETGVIECSPDDGSVDVTGLGFEPDLVLLSATDADRLDGDRTAGWTHGIVHRTEDGLEQHALSVADDAESTAQGTVGAANGAIDLVRHADGPLGRLRGRVSELTDDGFSLSLRTTGSSDDRTGVRALYQAFAAGDDLEIETGQFRTPTEPGGQLVEVGVDASFVALAATTGVGDSQTWTTDRSVGLSVGAAVVADGLSQYGWNGTTWPGRANHTAAVCGPDHTLSLCYQDGDRIAGQTTAAVTGLGGGLELRYDRTYSGPHKLDPTGSHPVSYVAIDAGELTPSVGVFRLPAPGETLEIDCGFEPGLLEFTTCRSEALGEVRATGSEPIPFGWSHGTAIVRGETVAQYALDGVGSAAVPSASGAVGGESIAATDGGRLPGDENGDDGLGRAVAAAAEDPSLLEPVEDGESVEAVDAKENSAEFSFDGIDTPTNVEPRIADLRDEDEGATVATSDGGQVATTLALDEDGVIVGRDSLEVRRVTETGFEVDVDGVRVYDHDSRREARPYVCYRAWPTCETSERKRTDDESKGGERR